MSRTTLRIALGQKTAYEANCIMQKVLINHKYTLRRMNGEFFWAYGNPKEEIIPCISSEIIEHSMVLRGWMYDEEENKEDNLKLHYLSGRPKRRVKAIMKEIAYIIKYKK